MANDYNTGGRNTSHINPDGTVVTIWIGNGAVIDNGAVIGDRAALGDYAKIGYDAKIGNGAVIGNGVLIGNNAKIGNGAVIGDYVKICNGAVIGDHTVIGDRVVIGYDSDIGDYAKIGYNSKIGDYAKIGYDAKIGCRAVIGCDDTTLQPIYIDRLGDDRHGWRVTMTGKNLQVGCKFHPLADWWAFTDAEIAKMDRGALRWWRKFRPVLEALAVSRGWEITGLNPVIEVLD